MVPSDDREGRDEEACLYGSEYYELEDAVVGVLRGRLVGSRAWRACSQWSAARRRISLPSEIAHHPLMLMDIHLQ
ncbi:MAG: hypothetical protein JXQ75_14925, partial [Phycisphaerae bacterium]|nr:hypothetical protein [Phycisphaerae bacterium]